MPHDPQVLEHEYDGIQEFDNPTPGWWHFLFFFFIVFGFAYMIMAIGGSPFLKSVHKKYNNDVLEATKRKFEALPDLEPTAMTFASYALHDEWMNIYAASVFAGNCATCHGQDGGGQIGPNLTDEYAKNIKVIEDIYTVISHGANANAMPAWGELLHPYDLILLTSYVASLRGTTPMIGKPAEGELMEPWPEAEPPVEVDEAGTEGG